MPLHSKVQEILEEAERLNLPPVETVTPEQARAGMLENSRQLDRPDVAAVENLEAPGPAGSIPVRVYTPAGKGPFPVITFYHGGGWVVGDLESHDGYCRHLANRCGAIVASVDYRLAPEHSFPAAIDDCDAATEWVARELSNWNGDPTRLVVAGDSAGGNLAAAVALRARNRGAPKVSLQILLYPITDADFDTPSYIENATGYHLTRSAMQWFWDLYVPDTADREHPDASPMRASELDGLAPAYVMTAEYDPLRDEGERYAKKLEQAGVAVTLERWEGMIHGFIRWTTALDEPLRLFDTICQQMDKAFAEHA
jgi:acetyl esterase